MGRSRDRSRSVKRELTRLERATQVNIPFTNEEGFLVIEELRKAYLVDKYAGNVSEIAATLESKHFFDINLYFTL